MKFSKLKIGTKFAATFTLLIALFLVVVGTAFLNLRTMKDASDWNAHTYEVLGHSSNLIAAVVNQETGVR